MCNHLTCNCRTSISSPNNPGCNPNRKTTAKKKCRVSFFLNISLAFLTHLAVLTQIPVHQGSTSYCNKWLKVQKFSFSINMYRNNSRNLSSPEVYGIRVSSKIHFFLCLQLNVTMMKNLKFLLSIKLNSYSRTKHFISSKVFWFSSKAFTSMTQVNIRGNGHDQTSLWPRILWKYSCLLNVFSIFTSWGQKSGYNSL